MRPLGGAGVKKVQAIGTPICFTALDNILLLQALHVFPIEITFGHRESSERHCADRDCVLRFDGPPKQKKIPPWPEARPQIVSGLSDRSSALSHAATDRSSSALLSGIGYSEIRAGIVASGKKYM